MNDNLEHPDISCALRTGYPYGTEETEDEYCKPFAVYDPE